LEFTPDLFRDRNDKLKKRLQTRNVIPVPDFSGINLSGNPLIKSKRARNEIIGRGAPVWSPVLLKRTCVSGFKSRFKNIVVKLVRFVNLVDVVKLLHCRLPVADCGLDKTKTTSKQQ